MRFVATAVLALCAAHPVFAWGLTGHRITGAVADEYLSPKARAGVKEVLGSETLAQAANWPDFMKSSPDPYWQRQSTPWHYVTIPLGKAYKDVGAPPEGDAASALAGFSAVVRDPKATLAERQGALRFIVHIVGDLSQPLHAGKPGDRGGNDVKVTFFGDMTNLHSVWDSVLIENNKLSYSEWAGWITGNLTVSQLRDWSSADPNQWMADSAVEREALYPAGPELRYSYVFEQSERLNRQLAKGGLRIAAYLNALFEGQGAAK